jgi:SPP1 gp7 family putative phage head morphogenesis protein
MTVYVAALYRRLGRRPPAPGPARERPPAVTLFEAAYYRRLRQFLAMWRDRLEHEIRGDLPRRADASTPDDLAKIWDQLLDASGISQYLGKLHGELDSKVASYTQRVTKLPPGLVASQVRREEFLRTNLALIKGMRDDHLTQLGDILRPAITAGQRWEGIAPQIEERLGVTQSRAKLIAVDQVGKLNSQLHEDHQRAAGITEYTWSTSKDGAVRGPPKSKENHRALEGTRHRWDQPPQIPGIEEHAHPGRRPRCRCVAVPVIPLFDGVDLFRPEDPR